MTLDEFLALDRPPQQIELSSDALQRLFWIYKGNLKVQERERAFWSATNNNLKVAYEKLDEQERQLARALRIIQDDLEVASEVQTALLPTLDVTQGYGLEIAAYHKQLNEVGGDYFDVFGGGDPEGQRHEDRVAIGVFDISGHGVSAALVMAYLKALFTQNIHRLNTPKAIVEAVNAASIDFLLGVKKYSTVNFVQVLNDRIKYVCGGGFGLVLRADGSRLPFNRRDHFLGLRRERPFNEYELPFEAGDTLALFTDGMIEAQDREGHDYSKQRLHDLIADHVHATPRAIIARCLEDYEQFRAEDIDDITLLIIRRRA